MIFAGARTRYRVRTAADEIVISGGTGDAREGADVSVALAPEARPLAFAATAAGARSL